MLSEIILYFRQLFVDTNIQMREYVLARAEAHKLVFKLLTCFLMSTAYLVHQLVTKPHI